MPQAKIKKTAKWIVGPIRRKLIIRKVKKRAADAEKRFFAFDLAAKQEQRTNITSLRQAHATHKQSHEPRLTTNTIRSAVSEPDFRTERAKSEAAWIRHQKQFNRLRSKKK